MRTRDILLCVGMLAIGLIACLLAGLKGATGGDREVMESTKATVLPTIVATMGDTIQSTVVENTTNVLVITSADKAVVTETTKKEDTIAITTEVIHKTSVTSTVTSTATTITKGESTTLSSVAVGCLATTDNSTTTITTYAEYYVVYVREGQGLGQVAYENGVPLEDLLAYNGISQNTVIHPGDMLKIPFRGNSNVNYQTSVTEEPKQEKIDHSSYNSYIENNAYYQSHYFPDNYIYNRYLGYYMQVEQSDTHEAWYSGYKSNYDYNSMYNINLACQYLNGQIVPAHSEFVWSDWERMGPNNSSQGYLDATVIAGNEYASAPGGGVCMVSSCTRNAAEDAGCYIIEAHNHTMNGVPIDMSYAPIGRQASVSYGSWDFIFFNPSDRDLQISAYYDWDTQTCSIGVIPLN